MAMSASPLTRERVEERLRAVEPQIRALGVARLALFGSVLRGSARADSDVDLLVQFVPSGKTFERFVQLGELLEERLGQRVEVHRAANPRRRAGCPSSRVIISATSWWRPIT
jgi:predicted nucleotidyltransferase